MFTKLLILINFYWVELSIQINVWHNQFILKLTIKTISNIKYWNKNEYLWSKNIPSNFYMEINNNKIRIFYTIKQIYLVFNYLKELPKF